MGINPGGLKTALCSFGNQLSFALDPYKKFAVVYGDTLVR